jgi:hypothetical protein
VHRSNPDFLARKRSTHKKVYGWARTSWNFSARELFFVCCRVSDERPELKPSAMKVKIVGRGSDVPPQLVCVSHASVASWVNRLGDLSSNWQLVYMDSFLKINVVT